MTRSEFQELVEYLGPKFDAIEARLARVEVGQEENRHQIQGLAEGITAVDQRLERFRDEVAEEFRAVRSEMAAGFSAVWSEFGTVRNEIAEGFKVQGELIQGLTFRCHRPPI